MRTGRGSAGQVSRSLLLLLVSSSALGCAKMSSPGVGRASPSVTEIELRRELIGFASRFDSVVNDATTRIRFATSEPEYRKAALLWEMQVVPLVQEAAFVPNVKEAFVAVGTVTLMLREFLIEGDGKDVFGPYQSIAVEAATELEQEYWRIGALFLSETQLAKLRGDIEQYMVGRTITGRDFTVTSVRRRVRHARESGRFDWIVDIPMSPFRALQGVGSGAAAIHEFNETARQFSRIVEGLPEQLRLQTQLLLYDIESRESLQAALRAFQSLTESARELAQVDDRLAASIDALLDDTEGALGQLNSALRTADGMLEPLRLTAEQVSLAGASWGAVFARDAERDPDARPFDVREWEATARGIGAAAIELQALAAELGALGESRALEASLGGLGKAVSGAEAGGRRVVDHAAWRGLQLLVVSFLLLLTYRLVTSRLASPSR